MKEFREMNIDELKEQAVSLYDAIYNSECYGVHDIRLFDGIINELEKRNVEVNERGRLIFEED